MSVTVTEQPGVDVASSEASSSELEPAAANRARFRAAFVDEDEDDAAVATSAPPWARNVVWACGALFLCALVACAFGHVEQTGAARGVLRYAGGSQTMSAQVTGTIGEILVHPGAKTTKGQVLAYLDTSAGRAALLDAELGVARATRNLEQFESERRPIITDRRAFLNQRVAALEARGRNQSLSVRRLRQKVATYEKLGSEGLASKLEQLAVADELSNAERGQLGIVDDVASIRSSVASLDQDLDHEQTQLRNAVRAAEDQRDAIALGIRQNAVIAQRDGVVDSVIVKQGDTVTPGTPVIRLTSGDSTRQVVAFIDERDRGFVAVDMLARGELDQFPPSEFGWVGLKVTRVAIDIASNAELREVFGDAVPPSGGALHRVEFELDDDRTSRALRTRMLPGSMVTTRYVLRKRRLLFVLVEPLRRLFE